jgi:hypothetical protein
MSRSTAPPTRTSRKWDATERRSIRTARAATTRSSHSSSSSGLLRDRINGTATIAGLDLDDMRALAGLLRSGPLIMPIALIDTRITPAIA